MDYLWSFVTILVGFIPIMYYVIQSYRSEEDKVKVTHEKQSKSNSGKKNKKNKKKTLNNQGIGNGNGISKNENEKEKEETKVNSNETHNNMQKNCWNELRKQQFDSSRNLIIENFQKYVKDPLHSNRLLYTFLDDKGDESCSLTFEQMDMEAKRVAGYLQSELNVSKGDRVILCFPPGLDFNISFWGCLYAGAVGVPVYPPYPGTLAQDLPRFNRLANDSQASIVLTNRTYYVTSKLATAKTYISSLLKSQDIAWPSNLNWIMTESISPTFVQQYKAPKLRGNDIAFFQYSSGSTSDPKAVIVSYGNIAAQLEIWRTIEIDDVMISWLPSYHDMGLFGFCIVPALVGAHCVSMSPIAFIKDPALWLRTVTKFKGTHICAPNFGYALAARKTTNVNSSTFNLHSLKHALCAAEPIREEVLLEFYNRFKSVGFRYEIFNCGYGLAEVTLVCAGQDPIQQKYPSAITIDKKKLEVNKIAVDVKKADNANGIKFINCGYEGPGFVMAIVDPETLEEAAENVVGEIWVKGASVALGYWNRPKETKRTFNAYISKRQPNSKADSGPYLRTGDLGFRREGCLYVTGRLKDLIIIRGRNICPQDVELTVEKATDAVRKGCIAAFSVEIQNEEKLIVVAELRTIYGEETIKKEIIRAITMSILREHQLCPYSLVLLQPKSIPKTTSGKIQRNATKRCYLEGNLRVQYISNNINDNTESTMNNGNGSSLPTSTSSSDLEDQDREDGERSLNTSTVTSPVNTKSSSGKHSPAEIEKWLMKKLTSTLENQPAGEANMIVDANTPWSVFGLDSISIVSLSTELGEYLDVVVPPLAFFEFETPRLLAHAPGLVTGELNLTNKNMSCSTSSSSLCSDVTGAMEEPVGSIDDIPESSYMFKYFSEYTNVYDQIKLLKKANLSIPYLDPLTDEVRKMLNYNTYNYLGLAGHPEVSKASKAAIDSYGTTMSSSPIVGQTMINIELEKKICDFYCADACVLFVGGWVANVTTIDALLSKEDLILCDTLNHNSCVTGQRLSGATVIPFPHNNYNQLEKILNSVRLKYRRVMIVIEGVYSMDGDIPLLPEYIRIKKKYKAMLFLDEAHSFGTIGKCGRGMIEYFPDVNPADIDIRMGTLSKAMGSTGGFMIGCRELIDILKFTAGGFVFSVGLTPCNAASALQSIKIIEREPKRVSRLQELSCYFYDLCVKHQLDIANTVRGSPVVVIIVGSSIKTTKVSEELRRVMINVKPIIYPGVEEGKGRLRFFLSYLRTEAEIEKTISYVENFISKLDL